MKVWKRCLAAVLSFIIFITSANISEAAGTYDSENYIWKANHAEILAEYYGISEKETDVLYNEAINSGYRYILFAPYPNGTKGKRDLMTVDYVNKVVYAKAYNTSGYTWLPTTAVVSAEGEVVETLTLTTGTCYYLNDEYEASQAFTYEGNKYTVEVIYQLFLNISAEEQNRILQIPAIMAQTADNLANQLKGLRLDTRTLGEMIPYLYELISLQLPKEETVVKSISEEDEMILTSTDAQTEVTETIITYEPALDTSDDAEEIEAITALYNEYTNHEGLILFHLSEEYKNDLKSVLTFADAHGAEIQTNSAALYEYANTLKSSTRLKKVINELKELNPDSYAKLQYLSSTLSSLNGTVRRPGPLRVLKEIDNWKILDEAVKSAIFKTSYSSEAFAKLESAAYALRSTTVTTPTVTDENILAAQVGISCDIEIHNVNVSVMAAVVTGEGEGQEITPLDVHSTTIILLDGTPADKVKTAIKESGIENTALNAWNAQNAGYLINTGNYNREETEISGNLTSDIEDYQIAFVPKEYAIETNFVGNMTLPFGYQLEFPVSTDEEISYDYVVETSDGNKVSYNEGVTYKITKPVSITQLEGSEKTEYRLYDFLVSDVQYGMSDEAKSVLTHAAIESPTLKIRIPDGSTVGEVVFENGVYRIEAKDFSAGILGMSWVPDIASVMDGESLLEEAKFADGVATWTTGGFTHVKVSYKLKIEKVKDGIMNRPLDEVEDVLYALNLPHDLVTHTVKQNHLLSGDTGVTVKRMYTEMNGVSNFMTPTILGVIGASMKNTAGKNAVLRLQGSENRNISGQNGENLGKGAWNPNAEANDGKGELALYTYLKLCADADWSLAKYYQQGLYKKVKEQAGIVASCLETIVKDPGFVPTLKQFGMEDKKDTIEKLIPQLKALAENIEGPHKAMKVNDPEFSSLIEYLVSLDGTTSAVDTSSGIYAYTSVRRNGEKGGSLTVSVKYGNKLAKTREITYLMDGTDENGQYHILTEDEAAKILTYIAELETLSGVKEEEKVFYDLICTGIPAAGDKVKKNEIVSFDYVPKEYVVTIAGVSAEEYRETFRYKSDYVITLPAFSENPEEEIYYRYWINEETNVKVANGTTGYYKFAEDELLSLFEDGHYEIVRQEVESLPGIEVRPNVILNEKIKASYYDEESKVLCLDAAPKGLLVSQFEKFVKFEYGDGETPEVEISNNNKEPANYQYLATGSYVYTYVTDDNGDSHETVFTVVLMGDVNCNGKVDSQDMQQLVKTYLGKASESEKILGESRTMAADMNGNGIFCDSNDALQIVKKFTYWDSSNGEYSSVLNK